MMKLILLLFVGVIGAPPAGVQGAPNRQTEAIAKNEQTASLWREPPTMLLAAVTTAGLVAARTLRRL